MTLQLLAVFALCAARTEAEPETAIPSQAIIKTGTILQEKFDKVLDDSSSKSVNCTDGTYCPDLYTCCPTSISSYGCCGYDAAVCCNYEFCCPFGYQCCDGNTVCCTIESSCCGSKCCTPGWSCCDNDLCCNDAMGEECCGGDVCCNTQIGESCCDGDVCCSSTYPLCCPDAIPMPSCCPEQMPICCTRECCPVGYRCCVGVGGGCCLNSTNVDALEAGEMELPMVVAGVPHDSGRRGNQQRLREEW